MKKNVRDPKPEVKDCPNPGVNIICLRCWGTIESRCECGLIIWSCTCETPRPSRPLIQRVH